MSVASAADPAESTLVDQGGGTVGASIAGPLKVPGDMLYEVIEGQIKEKIVGARETEIASLLIGYLVPFVRTNRLGKTLGEMLFRIDVGEDLQRRPDVAFVSHARWPYHRRVPDVAAWDMVPDLAIEVISPSNSAREVQRKVHEYFKAGVSRVWVIYPDEREVYVYSSTKQISVLQLGDDLDGGDLLPGFRLPLTVLFEDEAEAE